MTMTDAQIDRAYDREIAHLERVRRVRDEVRDFPVFATEVPTDAEIATGREDFPYLVPTGEDWETTAQDVMPEPEPADKPTPMCSLGLHAMTPDNVRPSNRQCKLCFNLTRRRKRAAENGAPLCWTGRHSDPGEGLICRCGQAPPVADFLDWAMVERTLSGGVPSRALTNAETVCAIETYRRQRHPWAESEAVGAILHRLTPSEVADFTRERVRYVVYDWPHGIPETAQAVLLRELAQTETAAPDESETAAS